MYFTGGCRRYLRCDDDEGGTCAASNHERTCLFFTGDSLVHGCPAEWNPQPKSFCPKLSGYKCKVKEFGHHMVISAEVHVIVFTKHIASCFVCPRRLLESRGRCATVYAPPVAVIFAMMVMAGAACAAGCYLRYGDEGGDACESSFKCFACGFAAQQCFRACRHPHQQSECSTPRSHRWSSIE